MVPSPILRARSSDLHRTPIIGVPLTLAVRPQRMFALLSLLMMFLSCALAREADAQVSPVDGVSVPAIAASLPDSSGTKSSGSKFIDPVDGWFDMSSFLEMPGGFVPLLVPITEPAVGYGAGGGLVFIRKNPPPLGGGYRKPNMLLVGGAATNDGTWSGFAGQSASWFDDRLQTLIAGVYGSVDLDFFGIGEGPLNDHPIGYDLEPAGGMAQAKYRLGRSPVQVGFGYGLIAFDAHFETDEAPEGIAEGDVESRVGGVLPALTYDTRDNVFTPQRGWYATLDGGVFREWLGGTSDFERLRFIGIAYRPLTKGLFLAARGIVASSFGDAPFYARPYITLRGAPVMAYMGEDAASVELETRWQFWKRFSAVGFVGAGAAWNDFGDFESERDIVTGGTGFRYELARRFGLHMGLDVAWGPEEPAIYVQFGNAWFRP